MKVVVKNLETYPRQVLYFRKNQYVLLQPHQSLTVLDVSNPVEVAYWESLIKSRFSVCLIEDECVDQTDHKEVCSDVHEDKSECSCHSKIRDLSTYTDSQLKKICRCLGLETRVRARWKLESLIIDNLTDKDDLDEILNSKE